MYKFEQSIMLHLQGKKVFIWRLVKVLNHKKDWVCKSQNVTFVKGPQIQQII